jgi:hypothetical protein
MEKNSTLVSSSRYVSGGTAEVNQTAIEWWDRASLQTHGDDITYIVEKKFEGRIDQIAATFLGEPRHWWIIAMSNNILDPTNEIREGVRLFIPTRERVKTILSGKLGGVPSTRELTPSIIPIV